MKSQPPKLETLCCTGGVRNVMDGKLVATKPSTALLGMLCICARIEPLKESKSGSWCNAVDGELTSAHNNKGVIGLTLI